MEGLDLVGDLIEYWEGVGFGSCADDEAVVLLGSRACLLVGFPVAFLTSFTAIVCGFAAATAERPGFGAGGKGAGGFHVGGLWVASPCLGSIGLGGVGS